MAGASVSVLVYHSSITAMNMPRGMIYTYVQDKGRKTAAIAKSIAPVRSGRLRGGIRVEQPRFSRNSVRVRVSSRAKHSIYVIEGTGPIISVGSTADGFFWMPNKKGSMWRVRYLNDIAGQDPNNFLERAMGLSMKDPFRTQGLWYKGNPFG
jgi:hypothetical protein